MGDAVNMLSFVNRCAAIRGSAVRHFLPALGRSIASIVALCIAASGLMVNVANAAPPKGPAATTTVMSVSPNPIGVGGTVYLGATVSPFSVTSGTSTVTFMRGTTAVATAYVNSDGSVWPGGMVVPPVPPPPQVSPQEMRLEALIGARSSVPIASPFSSLALRELARSIG